MYGLHLEFKKVTAKFHSSKKHVVTEKTEQGVSSSLKRISGSPNMPPPNCKNKSADKMYFFLI